METNNDARLLSTEEIFRDKYVIPLYQRNFAWDYDQILCFIRDMYECYTKNEDFYIGSLVVLPRGNGEYEVIDGQQRLTMLSLMSVVLGCDFHHSLRFDSRHEVERFFDENGKNDGMLTGSTNHYNIAKEWIATENLEQEGNNITIETEKNILKGYYQSHIRMVREIMPSDTDVALYFEIMNNRGEQLQEHEIVKARLLGMMKEQSRELSDICSQIWDACSQMDVRVQKSKSFSPEIRRNLFGENYDSFNIENDSISSLTEILKDGNIESTEQGLFEIIDMDWTKTSDAFEENKSGRKESKEESIIDFPNFLMHVLKLYYETPDNEIPLNDKYLLESFDKITWSNENRPETFFSQLLKCRVIFDRYIVKTEVETEEESRKWTLRKPKNEDGTVRFINTFSRVDEDDNDKDQQDIIYALSCLQTSFRQRPYKNFLQEILKWFTTSNLEISSCEYLEKLQKLLLSEYSRTCDGITEITEDKYTKGELGTNVHHFFFNFLDYLYWKLSQPDSIKIEGLKSEIDRINGEFRFLYRNSIEHHYPQKRQMERPDEGVNDYILNCLGNLILISKSVNSRLTDKNPIDKIEVASKTDLPPNRQIIYSITKECNGWGKEQITNHMRNVINILSHRESILGINMSE